MDCAHDSVIDFPSEILDDIAKGVPFGAQSMRDELRGEQIWTEVKPKRFHLNSDKSPKQQAFEEAPDAATLFTSSRFQVPGFDVFDVIEQEHASASTSRASPGSSKTSKRNKRRKTARKSTPPPTQSAAYQVRGRRDSTASSSPTKAGERTEKPVDKRKSHRLLALWTLLAVFLLITFGYAWLIKSKERTTTSLR